MDTPIDAIDIARQEIADGALLLRDFLPPSRLRNVVYRSLVKGRAVVLWPAPDALRLFAGNGGFVSVVEQAEMDFPGAHVAVPADVYDGEPVYVVHPVRTRLTLDNCPPGDAYRYRRKLMAAGLDQGRPMAGLSPRQIAELEQRQGVTLPRAYVDFLKECGRSAGTLCSDLYFFYPALRQLKQKALDLLQEARDEPWEYPDFHDFHLPDNAFVLSMYLAQEFHYFICDGHDDPPVLRCHVSCPPELIDATCSAYLDGIISS